MNASLEKVSRPVIVDPVRLIWTEASVGQGIMPTLGVHRYQTGLVGQGLGGAAPVLKVRVD